jgi:hypothetical protein
VNKGSKFLYFCGVKSVFRFSAIVNIQVMFYPVVMYKQQRSSINHRPQLDYYQVLLLNGHLGFYLSQNLWHGLTSDKFNVPLMVCASPLQLMCYFSSYCDPQKSAAIYKILSVISVSLFIRFIPRVHTKARVRISFHSIEENLLSGCPRIALPDRRKNENEIPFLDDTCRRHRKQSTQYEGI